MPSGLLRTVADVLLADTERGRMARTLIRGFIVGDDADSQDGPVRSLPQPQDSTVRQSPDSSTRTKAERPPAKTKPVLASDWPALRDKVRTAIAAKGLTRRQAAAEIGGMAPDTFVRLLGLSSRTPGAAIQARMRAWVEAVGAAPPAEGPAEIADPLPATMLSVSEQTRLSGYLSLGGNQAQLREQFGANRGTIEQAASGATLASEIIGRVRQGLANGAG